MSDREAFEAWLHAQTKDDDALDKAASGYYLNPRTHAAWFAWQAAR